METVRSAVRQDDTELLERINSEPSIAECHRVTGNATFQLKVHVADPAALEALIDDLLRLVGLTAHAGHRPRAISGGMAQRASLARALARNPGVLLLDEPFGALDALTRLKMQDLLLTIHAAQPTTVLLVTHDVDEALQLADRIVVFRRGCIAATLNAVADQFVAVAADLKRAKLDELTAILEEQRRYAETSLRDAEIALEGFRVRTVTLPGERSTPVASSPAASSGTTVTEQLDLWDTPAMFIALLALIATEWLLRRKRGLA